MGSSPYLIVPLHMIEQQYPIKLQYPCLVYHAHIKYKVRVSKQCMPLSLKVLHAPPQPPPKEPKEQKYYNGCIRFRVKIG